MKNVHEAQHVVVISDSEVAANFALLNVGGVDGDNDFHVLLELLKHTELAVRLEAGQDAGRVIIVKELAAELQIELAAETRNALFDLFRLNSQVFLIVKAEFIHAFSPFSRLFRDAPPPV